MCALGERWMISPDLAARLTVMADYLPYPLQIISGYRTKEQQEQLEREGRPTAPEGRSTHRSCPATGADLWLPTLTPVDTVKAAFGEAAFRAGLRWGGGSPVGPAGIPQDWNHVDLGPR